MFAPSEQQPSASKQGDEGLETFGDGKSEKRDVSVFTGKDFVSCFGPERASSEDTEYWAFLVLSDSPLLGNAGEGDVFGKLIVETYEEVHREKYEVQNTLSESVSVVVSGASPIKVSLSGKVLLSESDDHFAELLMVYAKYFRSREIALSGKSCVFTFGGFSLCLTIEMLGTRQTPYQPNYVDVSIQATGYYLISPGTQYLMGFGYVPTEGAVPTRLPEKKATEKEDEKKGEKLDAGMDVSLKPVKVA